MKFFTKLFASVGLLILAVSLILEFAVLSIGFGNDIKVRMNQDVAQFEMLSYSIRCAVAYVSDQSGPVSRRSVDEQAKQVVADRGEGYTALLDAKGGRVYQKLPAADHGEAAFVRDSDSPGDNITCRIAAAKGRYYCVTKGSVTQGDYTYRLFFVGDISSMFKNRDHMLRLCTIIVFLVLGVSGVILYAISRILSRPIKTFNIASGKIKAGKFDTRVALRRRDEFKDYAESFNRMAETIETQVLALKGEAKKKDEFIANFAHELKTPLTAIIGYADRLYQTELPREVQKHSASYIVNEGMRLEELAFKLMKLYTLDNQTFEMEVLGTADIAAAIKESVRMRFSDRDISFSCSCEAAYIRVEYDLFQTMLMNLIDNSIKANGRRIELRGRICAKHYRFTLSDDGIGMPEEALGRITEPFYMVDKSRSRKAHGAGLGLALAKKIAGLHHTTLIYRSTPGEGTCVLFDLRMEEEIEESDPEQMS